MYSKKNNHILTKEKLSYFEERLLKMRQEIIQESAKVLERLQVNDEEISLDDRSCQEGHWQTDCSLLDQEQAMLQAVDAALLRIRGGIYGICEETGEPIDLERLEAYPMTTLSFEAQKEKEKRRRFSYGARNKGYRPDAWN